MAKKFRILIPNIPYDDNFEDNVSFTLKAMGHEVLTMNKPNARSARKFNYWKGLFFQKAFPNELSSQEKWLLKTIKDFKPDIVLCLTQILMPEVLKKVKALGIKTIAWWGDTAANMPKMGLVCEGWDYVFLKDAFAVRKLKSLNINAHYLPEAMNPAWHNKYYKTKGDHLVFVGNAYNYRNYLITKLVKSRVAPVKLFGSYPPLWSSPEVISAYQNREVTRQEKSFEFGQSLACINSTAMSEFNSLNCRAFEVAGAGGLQILEFREAVTDCFEPDKEILTYSEWDELISLIEKAKMEPVWADTIRENGYKRAHADHTYEKRLKHILQLVGK